MSNTAFNKERYSKRTRMVLFILIVVWVVIITGFAQIMEWLMEQSLFESTLLFPDMRWLIHLSYTVLMTFPLLMVSFISQDAQLKIIFRFWAIIACTGFFFTAGRFTLLSQANIVSLYQIFGIFIFLMLILLFSKQSIRLKRINYKIEKQQILIVIGYIAIVSIPWVLWGALGSFTDTFLNFVSASLLSIFFLYVFNAFYHKKILENSEFGYPNEFLNGGVIFVGLLILSTTFGQNGQQWLLIFTVPFSSWLISGLLKIDKDKLKSVSANLLLGSLIAFPLCWFDPDELSLLIGSENGEILTWVNQAILFTIFSLLFLTAIHKRLFKKAISNKVNLVGKLLPLLLIIPIGVYFIWGQPGFFGESYIIVLEQYDDFREQSLVNNENPREKIFLELTGFAKKNQAEIINILNYWHVEYKSYYLVNAIEVKSGPLMRYYLSNHKDVDRIIENPNLRPLPQKMLINSGDTSNSLSNLWNLESLGVYQVWEDFGVKGAGIVIGQADSGVDGRHKDLSEQYLGYASNDDFHWLDPWNNSSSPIDINGHGTHTLGIILGKETGIAPESNWIGCVNLARNFGNPGKYLDCLQFLFAPYPQDGDPILDADPSKGADIINNSWGCPQIEGCDESFFSSAVTALRKSGIFMVVSNGNDGYFGCNSTKNPLAIYDNVVSVGAIDKLDELAGFSSLGPANLISGPVIKPDIVAPGVDIFSTLPNNTYGLMSGTSSSAPHVAGVVALMWSANSELIGNIDLTEKILFETSDPYTGVIPICIGNDAVPNNAIGYGIVNALKAVEASINLK